MDPPRLWKLCTHNFVEELMLAPICRGAKCSDTRKTEEGGKERRREGVSKTRKEELQSRRVAVRTL
jgi:hypothetical protein